MGKNCEYILHPVRCRGNPGGNFTFPEAQTAIDSIQIYDRNNGLTLSYRVVVTFVTIISIINSNL